MPSPDRGTLRSSGDLHGASWECDHAGDGRQLCSGITALPTADGGSYELGALELRDLTDGAIVHQLPFPQFSAAGHVVTRNPVAPEVDGPTLRMFAAPDETPVG